MKTYLLAAALLALPVAVQAQAQEISRSIFTFGKRSLTIDVLVESPGRLRVLRGRSGEVKVSARARDGFADAALSERGGSRLSLTAIGSGPVEFVVVVPEGARIRVRLPDRDVSEVFGSMQDVATYAWHGRPLPNTFGPAGAAAPVAPGAADSHGAAASNSAGGSNGAAAGHGAAPSRAAPLNAIEGLPVAWMGSIAPRHISIRNGAGVRRLSVRLEGVDFRVASSEPLASRPGSAEAVEIRGAAGMELVVTLPANTDEFLLEVDGRAALVIHEGEAAALCTPVTDQRLPGGRRWFTFTPADGRLRCELRPPAGIRST